jgi:mutator protein MutT
MIWQDNKILIASRPSGSHLAGFWEFPGGKREKGENLTDCLEREIEEELGFKVRVEHFLLTVVHEYDSRTIALHVFQCAHLSGEPSALQGQQIKWVDPGDISGFAFAPPDRKVLEQLHPLRPPPAT